jgi:hypothetical protein
MGIYGLLPGQLYLRLIQDDEVETFRKLTNKQTNSLLSPQATAASRQS